MSFKGHSWLIKAVEFQYSLTCSLASGISNGFLYQRDILYDFFIVLSDNPNKNT